MTPEDDPEWSDIGRSKRLGPGWYLIPMLVGAALFWGWVFGWF